MPDFEQVCRRLFSDPAWLGKCFLGAVLLVVPVAHFFAFGYLGRVAAAAGRGKPFTLPDWDEWRLLFLTGIFYFLIFAGFGGGLFLLASLASLPFRGWAGPLAYLPFIPAVILAPLLVAAGWYRYDLTKSLVEAFRLPELFALLRPGFDRLLLPTFTFIGFLFVGLPLFPLAFFVGGILFFFYYCSIFFQVQTRRMLTPEITFSVL